MIISIYRPIKILKILIYFICRNITTENIDVSCVKNPALDTMLSVIEKHTTSLKSGIGVVFH